MVLVRGATISLHAGLVQQLCCVLWFRPMKHETALLAYMKQNKIDTVQLADKLGVHRQQVSRWINGAMPSASRLVSISRKLGIDIAELL